MLSKADIFRRCTIRQIIANALYQLKRPTYTKLSITLELNFKSVMKKGKMLTYSLSLLLHVLSLHASSISVDIRFSRKLPDNVFLVIFETSLGSCRKECEDRPACGSLNYRRMFGECQLNDITSDTASLVEAPGYVHITKTVATVSPCGSETCTDVQVCYKDSGQCGIKECPFPPRNVFVTKGNMREVGSRLQVRCVDSALYLTAGRHLTTSDLFIECLDTGQWNVNISCVECGEKLVSGDHPILEQSLSASSLAAGSGHGAQYSRHDRTVYPGAWCAASSVSNSYIQARFQDTKTITAILTKGRHSSEYVHFVRDYTVSYSEDCSTYTFILAEDGSSKVFPGNVNAGDDVVNDLTVPIKAMCFRIHPGNYYGHVCLRFDVLGC